MVPFTLKESLIHEKFELKLRLLMNRLQKSVTYFISHFWQAFCQNKKLTQESLF